MKFFIITKESYAGLSIAEVNKIKLFSTGIPMLIVLNENVEYYLIEIASENVDKTILINYEMYTHLEVKKIIDTGLFE